MLEDFLTHGLQLIQDIVSFILCDVKSSVYFIHFIIDVIVELLVEFIFDILRKVVVKELVWELRLLRLWELRERVEVWRVLEALDIHHVRELVICGLRRHLPKVRRVHLPSIHAAKLIDIIVCSLIDLSDLSMNRNLSSKLLSKARLLRKRHEILLTSSHELLVHIEWLLPTALSMIDDILYALTKVLRVASTYS